MEHKGIGGLPLEPLQLRLNRRSRPAIVERVNALFAGSFPQASNDETGAVTYTASQAAQEGDDGVVTLDGFVEGEDQLEAACVVRRIQEARREDPPWLGCHSGARPLASVRHHGGAESSRAPLQRGGNRSARRTAPSCAICSRSPAPCSIRRTALPGYPFCARPGAV